MVNVLVTGAAGFVGTNLQEELLGYNHHVFGCDIQHTPDERVRRCDVGEYRQLERIFEDKKIDYVYHAAAEYGRWNGEDHYENLWRTNAVGTKNLLRLQREYGFKTIFFGSAEVYGDYDGVMSEDVMEKVPIKQMNDYAISKWVNEMQILNSAEMHGTETVRVRLFNVYGPHEHYSPYRGVVPIFIYNLLHNKPITVYRGHKRTFEYVKDICRTLANIIDNFKPGEVYNLGSETQYTIEELAEIVLKHTGADSSLAEYKSEEDFTTKEKIADSSKAKRDLDHKITVPLEEGIKRTVEWFKHKYRIGE
jgi:dTDP-glucose 4,6-dehydratase